MAGRLSDSHLLRIDVVPGLCFVQPNHDPESVIADLGEELQKRHPGSWWVECISFAGTAIPGWTLSTTTDQLTIRALGS